MQYQKRLLLRSAGYLTSSLASSRSMILVAANLID
jgi:hypothetical protein